MVQRTKFMIAGSDGKSYEIEQVDESYAEPATLSTEGRSPEMKLVHMYFAVVNDQKERLLVDRDGEARSRDGSVRFQGKRFIAAD